MEKVRSTMKGIRRRAAETSESGRYLCLILSEKETDLEELEQNVDTVLGSLADFLPEGVVMKMQTEHMP